MKNVFYGLNVCVLLRIHTLQTQLHKDSQGDGIRRQDLWEALIMNGMSAFIKEIPPSTLTLSSREDTAGK
mgnify:CR=1 FL=1